MLNLKKIILLGAVSLSVFSGMKLATNAQAESFQSEVKSETVWAQKLVDAAKGQIGETVRYDPAYVGLKYPFGDVPRDRGVCTDVVIRAYRDAFYVDLQKLVHEDMKQTFASYPKKWGLKRPDKNIDHRRVPNLRTFFKRKGYAVKSAGNAEDFKPGDVVSQVLPGNLTHIVIVSDKFAGDGVTPLVIHNIGAGTKLENRLFDFKITGHYRMPVRQSTN